MVFPFFGSKGQKEKQAIKKLVLCKPYNLSFYRLAFIHKSLNKVDEKGNPISNERLEFLGDSILNQVVSEWLYKQYPNLQEGELTIQRAKLINRDTCNRIGYKIGLDKWINSSFSVTKIPLPDSILGNTYEALIGAIYLDRGYLKAQKFILSNITSSHQNSVIEGINSHNYKGELLEWGQKHKQEIDFKTEKTDTNIFLCTIQINNVIISKASGNKKQVAQQEASKLALEKLSTLQFA